MKNAIQRHWPTILAGVFALAWSVFRSNVASITLDESDSYMNGVMIDWPSQWYASSGNHVLNTILMRLLAWIFGMTHLAVRGPALFGAAVYIVAIYRICTLVSDDEWLVFSSFFCFVYNPFVMDYLAVARGYSLALGFLMTALYLALREILEPNPAALRKTCAWMSACLALSFAANFSFAWVDFLCLLLFSGWKVRELWRAEGWRPAARLLLAATWPGVLLSLILTSSVVIDWPKGQLYYGSASLREMYNSLEDSTFYELNQVLVNPFLLKVLQAIQPALPILALLLGALQFAFKRRDSRLFVAATYTLALLILTLLCHWLQLKLFKIPLPKERTGIFLLALGLLTFLLATAMPEETRWSKIARSSALGLLAVMALYFAGCLRVVKFHEWEFDVDVRAAFPVLQEISRREGIYRFPTSWQYRSPLEFYRRMYHADSIERFRFADPPPKDEQVYILPYRDFEDFVRKERLTIVYHGRFTDLVIVTRKPVPDSR